MLPVRPLSGRYPFLYFGWGIIMPARYLKTIILITTSMLLAALPVMSRAAVTLDKKSGLKLFGDVRYRYEQDDRSDSTEAQRSRSLIRARIGASFQPTPAWTGNLRLSTDATSANSRDTTLSTTDTSKNGDFGLDQAYVAYTPSKTFSMFFGKTDFIFFEQREVFWDRDISPEAIALVARDGGVSFNATQITLKEGDWQKDATADAYQLVYRSGGITFAYGKAKINRDKLFGRDTTGDGSDDVFGFQSNEYTVYSAEEKRGSWVFGIEYITSNATSDDTARIISYQQQLGPKYGFRIYKYMVEGFSVMGDGMFSQDNFPVEGNSGVTNFQGYRLQFDFFTGKNSSVDLSFYQMDRIHDPASMGDTASDAIMTRQKQKRMQLNFNLQF